MAYEESNESRNQWRHVTLEFFTLS